MSRIGRVIIYCATVFCLLVTDFLIPSKPTSPISSSRVGYSHLLYPHLRGFLPVICRVTLFWKLSRARSILGVRTHVYALNSNTACATAL